jgi:ectoine hydroxylase-related dioxygenase (phytanoyl-CoA dioxygenase family)
MTLSKDLAEQLRDNGFCVLPDVLSKSELARARAALDSAVAQAREAGEGMFDSKIDHNDANIRVYGLAQKDPFFADLLRWPEAQEIIDHLLGSHALVSEFSANNALPGSRSMKLHSDQALVLPPPWDRPVALNIIWCLDDIHRDNGATLYLPGSHKYRSFEDVPENAEALLRPFEAPAGSIVAMEGRVWHTSGANVTADQQRRLMFAYYTHDEVQPAVDWLGLVGIQADR